MLKKIWTKLMAKITPETNVSIVYQGTDEFVARILKTQLESADIEVSFVDERDSSYNAFGYIYLKVLKENKDKAEQIINSIDE